MAVFKGVVGILLLAAGSYALQDPLRFTEPIQITPYVQQRALFNDAGLIPGARNCGGTGRLIKIRHEQCASSADAPCVIPENGVGRTEMIFVPSATGRGFGVVTRVMTSNGETKAYEDLFPELSVVAGREYALTAAGGATEELKGKHVTTQVEVFRMADRQVETCAEVDAVVV